MPTLQVTIYTQQFIFELQKPNEKHTDITMYINKKSNVSTNLTLYYMILYTNAYDVLYKGKSHKFKSKHRYNRLRSIGATRALM